ncbi:hypothetical protein [Pseudonocardia sp. NPDC049635]|uniref:hypothetical protein n=1 Tax=Pseudonocardia sp. NPDC049635 TaxID=3155506 RepID=UPI0033ECF822
MTAIPALHIPAHVRRLQPDDDGVPLLGDDVARGSAVARGPLVARGPAAARGPTVAATRAGSIERGTYRANRPGMPTPSAARR